MKLLLIAVLGLCFITLMNQLGLCVATWKPGKLEKKGSVATPLIRQLCTITQVRVCTSLSAI